MLGNKKRQLMIIGVAVIVVAVSGSGLYIWLAKTGDKDAPASDASGQNVDPAALVENRQRQLITQQLSEAKTPSERYAALLGATTLAMKDNDKDKALEYAKQAYELEGLSAREKYSAAMNLVETYGNRVEFNEGLEILAAIKSDSELMAVEAADFYVSRFEIAYSQNQMPGPINCQEPQTPEDCPVP